MRKASIGAGVLAVATAGSALLGGMALAHGGDVSGGNATGGKVNCGLALPISINDLAVIGEILAAGDPAQSNTTCSSVTSASANG